MPSLVPLSTDRKSAGKFLQSDFCDSVFDAWEVYYPRVGYHPPWIGYWLVDETGTVLATCGFKGPPKENRVEVAYGTVPGREGLGHGTTACRLLVELALKTDPNLTVTARTLREENASTRILIKNGFRLSGTVTDPEDGEVWEWVYLNR
jgi:RimJ/RimL family protein N-acetyltransferase